MCVWGGGERQGGGGKWGGGSPKVHYFMIDPWAPSRLSPKMNTINFNKVGLIVCEGDSVCVCVRGGGGQGGGGKWGGGQPQGALLYDRPLDPVPPLSQDEHHQL